LISTHTWKRLNDQQQNWLQEAVEESAIEQRRLWQESEAESLAAVEEAGVEIIRPDKALFSNKVESIYESYRDDEKIYALINQIRTIE
jgi:TRAP-type C4-dicarboxylate transport system substrate-binding protein